MQLKVGNIYKILVDVPLWAKENHIDDGEGYYNNSWILPPPHMNINFVHSGSNFMFLGQSMRSPYTYKILYEDQAGWIFLGSYPLERSVEEVIDDGNSGTE
jgi:hypothetical protein